MKREEIDAELAMLKEDQFRQSAVISASDAHACKCTKMDKDFQTEYPEEYAEYVTALDKFHANEARIAELEAMEPEDEERPIDGAI